MNIGFPNGRVGSIRQYVSTARNLIKIVFTDTEGINDWLHLLEEGKFSELDTRTLNDKLNDLSVSHMF